MLGVNPYLNFMGNSEEAMKYYKSLFGGEFAIFSRFKEMPGAEKMSPADQEKIIHISLVINKHTTIMATDYLESMEQKLILGNNSHICIQSETEAEADKFFEGLSKGGKVEMPMNKTFWGAYFGMCVDKFGVSWMINYTYEK